MRGGKKGKALGSRENPERNPVSSKTVRNQGNGIPSVLRKGSESFGGSGPEFSIKYLLFHI